MVSQAKSQGKKLVFYGDDTWLSLFPEHFIRSDGTTSFFVTDYTEVGIEFFKSCNGTTSFFVSDNTGVGL